MTEPAPARVALRRTLDRLWGELEARTAMQEGGSLLSAELALVGAHGPLRVGLDEAGYRHLLVPLAAGDGRPVDDRRSGGVHLGARTLIAGEEPVRFADLVCLRRDLHGVFTGLAADVCERVAMDSALSASGLGRVLDSWRNLFAGGEAWTASRLAGLFGELLVLERLLGVDSDAVIAWRGPYGAAQDFRSARHAIEAKTTTSGEGRTVRIHGTDQLETPAGGSLTLVWFRLAARSAPAGRSVADVQDHCLELADDPASVMAALDVLRFPALSTPVVRNTRFEVLEERWYPVEGQFPRVTPEVFATGAVPGGVGGVEYLIDLDTVPNALVDGAAVVKCLVEDL
jgi:hypothetical protein